MSAEAPDGLKTAVLAYDLRASTGDRAAADVCGQLDAIETVLAKWGVTAIRLGVGLDLSKFKKQLGGFRPDLVFNLVESLELSDRLQTMVPLLLEDCGVPFTGCGSIGMILSNHKIRSKQMFAGLELPFPPCARPDAAGRPRFLPGDAKQDVGAARWIVKALESHASLHLDDSSIIQPDTADQLAAAIAEASTKHGQTFFAEQFIEGREFNLSLIEDERGGPEVMPAAEIRFDALPEGKPRIVGYAAKWDEDSSEYAATPRTFDLAPGDAVLVDTLNHLARSVWNALGLSGYARVDFRVDAHGRPWILEANANPDPSPEAGLAAAARRGELDYAGLVARIARAGLRRK